MASHSGNCRRSRRSFLKGSGLTLAGSGLSSLFPGYTSAGLGSQELGLIA
jgi:hypothetical protein